MLQVHNSMKRFANQSQARSSRRGSATVIVLMVVFSLMVMGIGMYQLGNSGKQRVLSTFDDERALSLAESGLAEALTALRAGATGNVGTSTTPAYMAGGVFWTEASDADNGTSRIKVTALIGKGRRSLEAIVDAVPGDPLFSGVLTANNPLILNQGVVIDSFHSGRGDYLSQASNTYGGLTYAGSNGNVSSNGDIFLNDSTTVFGDATPGVGMIVDDAALNSYVSGDKTASTLGVNFPPIDYPVGTTSAGDVAYSGLGNTLAPGTYEFDAFSLDANSELTIQGPADVVMDDFSGATGGRLLVDATGGPVTFFVRNTYAHAAGFEVDATPESPAAIAFMYDGTTDLVFPGSSTVRGAYYAPKARMTFSAGSEYWGAFSGSDLSLSDNTKLHFDDALLNYWNVADPNDPDPRAIMAWSEIQVDPQLAADRRDPMKVLGLDRRGLPSPSQAWDIGTGSGNGSAQ